MATLAVFTVIGGVNTASASSSAQAVINWDSLNFQLTDFSGGLNAPVLNWTSKFGSVNSSAATVAPSDGGSSNQSRNNFSTNLSVNTVTDFAQSVATRNGSGLTASASSERGLTSVYGNNTASASVSNTGGFQLSGKGLLLITLDWSVSSTGSTYDWNYGANEWANASVSINGSYNGQFNSGNASSGYSTNTYSWINSDPVSRSGTFSMAVYNDGLGITAVSLSALASADVSSNALLGSAADNGSVSSVPLPGAVWLFGAGLFGFLWQAKRKIAVAA